MKTNIYCDIRKLFSRTSGALVSLSIGCAFLAIALSCFDLIPVNTGYYPPRPTYFIMLAGMLFWFLSGRWLSGLAEHRALFSLVAVLLIWGGLSTYCGVFSRDSSRLTQYFMITYCKWRIVPFLGLCWFASLFSSMPRDKAIRIFSLALLCLFIPNAIHMLLEFIANMGATSVKEALIAINPYVRREAVAHGWWPPPYFEGRIRGFFLEPAFMINGLIPLLGLLAYAASRNKTAFAPLALLAFLFIASRSFSATLVLVVFFGLFAAYRLRNVFFRHKPQCLLAVVALCLALPFFWHVAKKTPQYRSAEPYFANIGAISRFVRESHENKTVAMPKVDYSSPTRYSILSRLLVMRLDGDTALRYPLGIGFGQRGFYWAPLDAHYASLGNEEKIWVRDASRDFARNFPPLSEYTATLAEAGFPGFILLVGLLGYIGFRGGRNFLRTRDAYMGFMLCAYATLLADLVIIALVSSNIDLLFAGYFYAISGKPGHAASGHADAPRPRAGSATACLIFGSTSSV